MPVQKFKSHDEARRALWNFNPDADYYKTLSALFDLAGKLNRQTCQHGIQKFRTYKEYQKYKVLSSPLAKGIGGCKEGAR